MRALLAGGLASGLLAFVTGGSAQEWRPVARTGTPPAVAAGSSSIKLHRPTPLPSPGSAQPRVDSEVRPVAFSSHVSIQRPQPITFRAKADVPQPLPPGAYPVGQVIAGEPCELRSAAEPVQNRPYQLPVTPPQTGMVVAQPGPMCNATTLSEGLVSCDPYSGGMVEGGMYYGDEVPLECGDCGAVPGGMCDTYGMQGNCCDMGYGGQCCAPTGCHQGCQHGYGYNGPFCLIRKLFGCHDGCYGYGQNCGQPYGHNCGQPYAQNCGHPQGQCCGHPQAQNCGHPQGQCCGHPYAQNCGHPQGQHCGHPYGCGHGYDGMYGDCSGYRRPCFWIGGEYVSYRLSDQRVFPLVTDDVGNTLFGANQLNEQERQRGARVFVGFWFSQSIGFDANWMNLGRDTNVYNFDGTVTVVPAALDVDNLRITSTQYLWSADANFRKKLINKPNSYFDLLVGFRTLQLNESLAFDGIDADPVSAKVETTNRFYGGQVGFDTEYRFAPRWSLGGMVKVAIGSTRQSVRTTGTDDFVLGDAGRNAERNIFTVVPEAQVRLSHDVSDRWRVYVAYDVIAATSVVRPAGQIGVINQPAVMLRDEGFIAHGINVGLMCTY